MITPEVKTLTSIDADDLETWRPDGPSFSVTIDLEIGATDGDASDRFQLYVSSPAWLEASLGPEDVEDGRHLLIVKTFDYRRIRGWIEQVVARSSGEDWDEVAGRLCRYFAWEFEDYQDAVDPPVADLDARLNGAD